ncbi:MAG: GFA family protein [Allorhizobium sp.]
MEEERTGHCLCGGVSFAVEGKVRPVVYCHCSQCRRQTGLHYAATEVPRDRLTVAGENLVSWYRASAAAERGFCSRCGSALFWRQDGNLNISILAGAFDPPSGLVGGYHIYCADRGDFYTINDDLPQYQAGTPS